MDERNTRYDKSAPGRVAEFEQPSSDEELPSSKKGLRKLREKDKRQWSEVDALTMEAERERIRGAHPRLTDENFGAIVRHGAGGNEGDHDVGRDWF